MGVDKGFRRLVVSEVVLTLASADGGLMGADVFHVIASSSIFH